MNDLDFKIKYIKYKLKYLQLKQNKQSGGMDGNFEKTPQLSPRTQPASPRTQPASQTTQVLGSQTPDNLFSSPMTETEKRQSGPLTKTEERSPREKSQPSQDNLDSSPIPTIEEQLRESDIERESFYEGN